MNEVLKVASFLGDPKKRYFGEGHKKARYRLFDTEEIDGCWRGFSKIERERGWSEKAGKTLSQHLTTIDGLMISFMLVEEFLEETAPHLALADFFLSSFEIKAGSEAIEGLEAVAVCIESCAYTAESVEAKIVIENMVVWLGFEKSAHNQWMNKVISNEKFIQHHLIDKQTIIDEVTIADRCLLNGWVTICGSDKQELFSGLQSHHFQQVSLLNLLIPMAQMAEVLAYVYDDILREESENFWMRHIKARYLTDQYLQLGEPFEFFGEITRARLATMRGDSWRSFQMVGKDTGSRITFEAKVAHQINVNNQMTEKMVSNE